jgi:hypothetical protein
VVLLALSVVSGEAKPSDGIATKEWPCPDAESIAPCVCTSDENYALVLDCSQAVSTDELANAFKTPFPFNEFDALKIKQADCETCFITSLPAGVFGSDVTFKDVDISGTRIEVVEEGVFSASHAKLKTLRLTLNQIHTFPFESLENYQALGYFYLDKNQIQVETPIPSLTFEHLTIINLSSNKIIISPDFVSDCPSIKQVRLRNTRLDKIPSFDVSPISMFSGLQNIEVIDFGNNQITEVSSGSIVAEASSLKTVDLSQNKISRLESGFVSGFSADKKSTLDLSSNSIVRLDQDVWEDILNQLPQENSVDISQNPLLCGCDVKWLIQSPLKKSLTNTTTCMDGKSIVKYLPEQAFLTNC